MNKISGLKNVILQSLSSIVNSPVSTSSSDIYSQKLK